MYVGRISFFNGTARRKSREKPVIRVSSTVYVAGSPDLLRTTISGCFKEDMGRCHCN